MSNDDRSPAEMLAEHVTAPIDLSRFLDEKEAAAGYFSQSETRHFVLRLAWSLMDEAGRNQPLAWVSELTDGTEELIPPVSRSEPVYEAWRELRELGEWLADLD